MKVTTDFIRPSSLYAIADCPGRPRMECAVVNAYGEPESAEAANVGTRGHLAVADAIEHWRLCQDTGEHGASWGDTIALARNEAAAAGVDGWTVLCIQRCLEFARDLIVQHDIHPDNVLVEQPLHMEEIGMKGGTADLILVVPFQKVIVVDWKFAFVDQGDASDHDQLQAYATASSTAFRTREVIVYLYQARAPKPIRASAARFDAAALASNAAWTRAVVARALSPDPELAPSYAACVYCRALPHCKAAKEYVMNASEALAALGCPIDPDGYGELADAAKLAAKFGEDGKDLVRTHMLAGGEATGWNLGTPRAIQAVANVPEAMQKLRDAGLEAEVLASACSLSVSKLPTAALEVIQDHLTEKLSSPPLTQNKRARA